MLAQKGVRGFVVNGEAFHWKVSAEKHGLHLVAELQSNPGSRLIADFPYSDGEWQITPSMVASLITNALDAGWIPDRSGPEYVVKPN